MAHSGGLAAAASRKFSAFDPKAHCYDLPMKTCSKCGQEKPFSEFHKDAQRGYKPACKACRKAESVARYAENAERLRAEQARKYRENPEKRNAATAAWRERNAEKVKATNAAYRAAHAEQRKEYNARWAEENADRKHAAEKAWRQENPEKDRQRHAAYRERHPEKHRTASAKWRKANPDKSRAATATYQAQHPEQRRTNEANRRARKQAAGGTHTLDDIAALFRLQRGKCACCHASIKRGYHVDHIQPLALGGSNDKGNLQLLCPTCNTRKSAKHPIDFMRSRGLLL